MKAAALLVLALSLPAWAESPLRIASTSVEHDRATLGIAADQPRLSWQFTSPRQNERQTAYELRAALSHDDLPKAPQWSSGKVMSDQSTTIPWGWGGAKPLRSRDRVIWQVRAWDADGEATPWSDPAAFEVGILSGDPSWKGQWITTSDPRVEVAPPLLAGASWIQPAGDLPEGEQVSAFRKVITLPATGTILAGVANVSTEGAFSLWVNGKLARNIPRRPNGWKTPTRCDVTVHLHPGANSFALLAGPPAANGHRGVIANVEVALSNGTIHCTTDEQWKASFQPALPATRPAASVPGSTRPATPPTPAWATESYDDATWAKAATIGPYGVEPWGTFEIDNRSGPGRYLRKQFALKPNFQVAYARFYASALGVYRPTLNGRPLSAEKLAPGFSDYHKRVFVQTYDVTRSLRDGDNVMGVILADGWYAGRLGWMGAAQYGTHPAFVGQLEVTYADGSRDVIPTDASWLTAPPGSGRVVASDQQWGDVLDARRDITGWDTPAYNISAWTPALVEQHDVQLQPQVGPPVRQLMELKPVSVRRVHHAAPEPSPGERDHYLVDFGQNLVGAVRLRATGPAGTTLHVRHGERLADADSLYTANLRPALATDTFILAGTGKPEIFLPPFTFHGFQYVDIEGYPGTLKPEDIQAVVLGSALPAPASFDSSDPMLNRLYQNIAWGQRGNFLSIPTDCPQRDERLGWMGDAQVFAPTAARLADVSGFFEKWLIDVRDGQSPAGEFNDISPRINRNYTGTAAWADAGAIVPWAMYEASGDRQFLSDNYAAMKAWVDYLRKGAPEHLRPRAGIGDWLSPGVTAPLDLVATAYYARSTWTVAQSAAILGKQDDAATYTNLFHQIAGAFQKAYVADDGTVKSDTQTAYLLALHFNLLSEDLRPRVAQKFAARIEQDGHLTTGFIGVGMLCPTLTAIGRSDLAWQLLLNDTYPSWFFQIKNGATTIWERWDGYTPDKGFQDPAMNSFNHYSLGSVGEWLFASAAGIQPAEAGYKKIRFAPQFTPRLTHLSATQPSPYGPISASWVRQNNTLTYQVTLPPNTTASVELPNQPPRTIGSGTYTFDVP